MAPAVCKAHLGTPGYLDSEVPVSPEPVCGVGVVGGVAMLTLGAPAVGIVGVVDEPAPLDVEDSAGNWGPSPPDPASPGGSLVLRRFSPPLLLRVPHIPFVLAERKAR